ncbi:MAG: bifunctional 5,10-methylene-tetrahydrofolate dehydrogenase/5,10-methylene-tetrahydrofolate cyclohydrolase [Verrucomicrobia bacterium]|nr:bifunctional 5,10-methylene-tetrahydrofolate dehydrogenase/5,10-methylene-tetrahydrofolate cyclohydrolase [Verrucomicrobiota bacterium]
MINNLIDGKAIAAAIHEETAQEVASLLKQGIQPAVAFVRVGEDPASKVYVGMKEKMAAKLGIKSILHILPESTSEAELLVLLNKLNADRSVHGILVQAPLPKHIDQARVFETVLPNKDVDGFHPVNVGKLLLGDTNGFVPCTPGGIHELLIRSGVETSGANVVILGRGNIVGKPMASILMQKGPHANATVTICHSRSRNIESICRNADILIAALGVAEFVKADMVKPGAVVIDVGVNRINDANEPKGYRLVGDVDFNAVQPIAGKITPNPGGVGPMTIAMLMKNTVRAAKMANLKQ